MWRSLNKNQQTSTNRWEFMAQFSSPNAITAPRGLCHVLNNYPLDIIHLLRFVNGLYIDIIIEQLIHYPSDLSMGYLWYIYIHIHLDNHWSHGIVPCVFERCHWQFHLSRGFATLLGSVVPRPSRSGCRENMGNLSHLINIKTSFDLKKHLTSFLARKHHMIGDMIGYEWHWESNGNVIGYWWDLTGTLITRIY